MDEVLAALRAAKRIALVSHRDPDPDTIGSAVAVGLALEQLGKTVSYHCADPVPEFIRFLARADRFSTDPPPGDADLMLTVDFGDAARAKFALPPQVPVVNVDHHATNLGFGDAGLASLVDVSSAATGELISRVIDGLGARWTPEMATAALLAIMTDTGSFQFPNTDSRALERAARLRDLGADLQAITYNVFRNKRFEALKLTGIALTRLVREDGGLLVWSWADRADVVASGAREEDMSGLVQQIARSSGMRLALLFSAQEGGLRVSCRTSVSPPSVDAAALMARFGGGGHVRAAGALIPGEPAEIRERVLAGARLALAEARAPRNETAPPAQPRL